MDITEKMVLPDNLNLHVRSAAKLVLLVSRYRSEVTVHNGPKCANAKSIIGLAALDARAAMELVFNFRGDDAEEACQEVKEFFQRGLDR